MKSGWDSFCSALMGMMQKPMWLMLLWSLCLMSTVYLHRSVWDLPVAVIDMDHSPASRLVIRQLDATPKVTTESYDNLPTALRDLGLRKLFAVILLPQDLEQKMLAGTEVTIPVYGDATNRLANGQIQQDVLTAYQQMVAHYNMQLMLQQGFSARQASVILTPFIGQTEEVFNPGISFAAITFPGMLVMLLQHSLLIASVRVNIAMRSEGNKPSLAVSIGTLSALVPIWLFLSIVLFGLWPWVLGYRQMASLPELLLLTLPFELAVLGMSKLVTECIRSVERIYLTLAFITTPVYYLSGTIWPIQSMPDWVRFIALMFPSTWGARMIAGVNQMGLSLSEVKQDVLILLILGAIYATAGFAVAGLRSRYQRDRLS